MTKRKQQNTSFVELPRYIDFREFAALSKQRSEKVFGLQERHTFLINFLVIIQHEFSTQMMLMTQVDKPKTQTPYSVRGNKNAEAIATVRIARVIYIYYTYIYIYIYIYRKTTSLLALKNDICN